MRTWSQRSSDILFGILVYQTLIRKSTNHQSRCDFLLRVVLALTSSSLQRRARNIRLRYEFGLWSAKFQTLSTNSPLQCLTSWRKKWLNDFRKRSHLLLLYRVIISIKDTLIGGWLWRPLVLILLSFDQVLTLREQTYRDVRLLNLQGLADLSGVLR